MIIDVHNHIGLSAMGTLGRVDELLSIMKESHIDKAVIFPIDEIGQGKTYTPQNDKIITLVKEYPEQFLGVCRVRPTAGEAALEEMHRCKELGFLGVKFHPKSDQFVPEDALPMIALARDFDWPIVLHSEHLPQAHPLEWEDTFKNFPEVNFILTHGGKDAWPEVARIASELNNVYLDTSTLSYNRTRMLLEKAGYEKIVFGSDYPYSHPELELRKYQLLVKDPHQLDQIFFKTTQALFKF